MLLTFISLCFNKSSVRSLLLSSVNYESQMAPEPTDGSWAIICRLQAAACLSERAMMFINCFDNKFITGRESMTG
jgi:hypothetical protein